jgi:hypothetical protein
MVLTYNNTTPNNQKEHTTHTLSKNSKLNIDIIMATEDKRNARDAWPLPKPKPAPKPDPEPEQGLELEGESVNGMLGCAGPAL